jgi:predicted CoA-binding protein
METGIKTINLGKMSVHRTTPPGCSSRCCALNPMQIRIKIIIIFTLYIVCVLTDGYFAQKRAAANYFSILFMDSIIMENILASFRHIAVVGISAKPDRPSNSVARAMMKYGYTIYPVNPGCEEVLGLRCYPSLSAIPPAISKKIEIVNIFRKSADVPPVVDEAIAIGAKVIWMQLGIVNEDAAVKARSAGLIVVENRCIAVEEQRLFH